MVLLLKQWKSRSSPGFAASVSGISSKHCFDRILQQNPFIMFKLPLSGVPLAAAFLYIPIKVLLCWGPDGDAGWSSPVARQAHNLKVAGSNPAPATNKS